MIEKPCTFCKNNFIPLRGTLCDECKKKLAVTDKTNRPETIREYIERVFRDFQAYAAFADNLCKLNDLTFQGGALPDYDDENIRQLYLLRYAYAYGFEYKHIYAAILYRQNILPEIEVTSLGCGNLIDYWGLASNFNGKTYEDRKITYYGLDVKDWDYKVKCRKQDDVFFIQKNAADWFDDLAELTSDVYVFPKSISEFSDADFDRICDNFKTKPITKDIFHVFICLRSDSGSMTYDTERSKKIMAAVTANGFTSDDDANLYRLLVENEKKIRELDDEFSYPGRVITYLKELNIHCAAYEETAVGCTEHCDNLTRFPILNASYVKYQLFTFKRT